VGEGTDTSSRGWWDMLWRRDSVGECMVGCKDQCADRSWHSVQLCGVTLPTWHILQEDVEAVAGSVKLVADVAHDVGVAQVLVALQLLDDTGRHRHRCKHRHRSLLGQSA
jgi:hypothetical protein